MNDKGHHIIGRFPDKSHTLARLMAEDQEFFSLCEDYDSCVDAMHYWSKSTEPEAETRIHEYRNLIRELEEEITQVLVTLKPTLLD